MPEKTERAPRERGDRDRDRGPRREREAREPQGESGGVATVSFEEAFDAEVANEFGDLGPSGGGGGGGDDGGERSRRPRGGRRR
jgi:polyribonucleotide nucleotidyltransferase